MRIALTTILLALTWQFPVLAELDVDVHFDGPQDWQIAVNVEGLRSSQTARPIYQWLRAEVFDDVEDELDLNVDTDIDSVWAHGVEDGFVASFEGPLADDLERRLQAAHGQNDADVRRSSSGGTDVYSLTGATLARLVARNVLDHWDDDDGDQLLELAFAGSRAVVSTVDGAAGRAAQAVSQQPAFDAATLVRVSFGPLLSSDGRG